MNISFKKEDLAIYIGIAIYTIARFIERVNTNIPSSFWNILTLVSCLILFGNVIFIKQQVSFKGIIVYMFIMILLYIDSIPSGAHELIYLLIVIYCVQSKKLDNIVEFVYILTAVMTLCVVILALIGVLPNISVIHSNRVRYNMGFYGYDVLPLTYISLVFGFALFYKKKPRFCIVALIMTVGGLVYHLTKVRAFMIILSAFVVLWVFVSYRPIKKWKYINCIKLLPIIYVIISLIISKLYEKHVMWVWIINGLINHRISLQHYMLNKYGITWLSNIIPWEMENDINSYMYVDNSYIYLMLTWGIIGVSLIMLGYILLLNYAISKKNSIFLVVVVSILTLGIFWNILGYFQYVEILLYCSIYYKKVPKIIKNVKYQGEFSLNR